MSLRRLRRPSLRQTLIATLLAVVMVGSVTQVLMTWRTAQAAVDAAFDRSLYGAIRATDASVSTESGGLGIDLPYLLFEFFELTASGPIYYRVATEDGLVEIGSPDLPMPAQALSDRVPHFETVDYHGSQIRIGTYARPIDAQVGGLHDRRLVIQVAEAVSSRSEFSRQFIRDAIVRDVLLACLAAMMAALAVTWSLRPLRQLQSEVQQRAPDDLSPMDTSRVPADVLPLVDAINQHVSRSRKLIATQRSFVDHASHQLRTPLATLLTQLGYAQRERDEAAVRQALGAMHQQLQHTIRHANRLLDLARADTMELQRQSCDLVALARSTTTRWWPSARARQVDLGFDAACAVLPCPVQPELIHEALSNLIDNALRYTPRHGRVTVRVERTLDKAWLHVGDSGAGIAEPELSQLTRRFYRGSNAQGAGTGLGLSIVGAIAKRHRGRLVLGTDPVDGGLRCSIELPLPDKAAQKAN